MWIEHSIPCTRLYDYEILEVESLWTKITPYRLPRLVSMILEAVVYHSTSCGSPENQLLLQHLQTNIDSFLRHRPDGLIMITGDFNPTSTGLQLSDTTRILGLAQIVKVLTRDSGSLDWCLTNRPNLFHSPKQSPKLGTSDHYTLSTVPVNSSALVKNTQFYSLET